MGPKESFSVRVAVLELGAEVIECSGLIFGNLFWRLILRQIALRAPTSLDHRRPLFDTEQLWQLKVGRGQRF